MSDHVVILDRLDGPLPDDAVDRWFAEDSAHGVVLLPREDRKPGEWWSNGRNYGYLWGDRVDELDASFDLRLVIINKSVILPTADGGDGVDFATWEYRRVPHGDWVRVSAPPGTDRPNESVTAVF